MSTARKLISAGAKDIGAWDLSYAYYDPSNAWDLSLTNSTGNFSVAGEEITPQGLFIKPDGTKVYVVGNTGDDVNEYSLSTAWDITTASYVQNFSVAAQETAPNEVFFKPDGTKMYITGGTSDSILEYDLSTAWDISTASYLQAFDISAEEIIPQGLFFKPDGTKMYVVGSSGDDVNEYNLSTAWDVSSASYLQNFSVAGQDTAPQAIFFKPDGTKMYVGGGTNDSTFEYDLSTAWDVSTASYVQGSVAAAARNNGIFFKPDGTVFYFVSTDTDRIYQYVLGGLSVNAQETTPTGLFFKPDGTKMYVVGSVGDDVNEYNLSTAWDVSSAAYLQNFSVAAQETIPEGLFFKPDGTKMYITGGSGDDVNEYSLSTAWDISTASYIQNFSVAAEETAPTDIFFRPDGVKMYVLGDAGNDVNEYSLSTAWDISTASFVQREALLAQENAPQGLFFKPDGTKMYVTGNGGDDVNEYDLSTAWDVSTSSYVQNFSIATQVGLPSAVFFRPDGTQMFIIGEQSDIVYPYSIGPQ